MFKRCLFILIVSASVKMGFAQSDFITQSSKADSLQPSTVQLHSPIRSLSAEDYNAYKLGERMGMAKAAELNNYPGPGEVLEVAEKLKLTAIQRIQLTSAYDEMKRKALEMGVFILQQEKKLNDIFASGKANEGSIIFYTNKIGLYQGELRNAHLQANLKARRILTSDQIRKYNQLQGYPK